MAEIVTALASTDFSRPSTGLLIIPDLSPPSPSLKVLDPGQTVRFADRVAQTFFHLCGHVGQVALTTQRRTS